MGDPTDDFCTPRPLRTGLTMAAASAILEEAYTPAIREALTEAARKIDATGPPWWLESSKMRRAWPKLVLFPRLHHVEWMLRNYRQRARWAWQAAVDDWNESGG